MLGIVYYRLISDFRLLYYGILLTNRNPMMILIPAQYQLVLILLESHLTLEDWSLYILVSIKQDLRRPAQFVYIYEFIFRKRS